MSAGDLSEHSVSVVHFHMSSALLSPLTHRVSAVIIVFWTVFAEDTGLQLFIRTIIEEICEIVICVRILFKCMFKNRLLVFLVF